MKAKKKSKAALKASKKAFKAELTKHVKAAKVKTKKVEIREEESWPPTGGCEYAFGKPNVETHSGGYARPFTAKRGAERHFKDFIAKGGRLVFLKNY